MTSITCYAALVLSISVDTTVCIDEKKKETKIIQHIHGLYLYKLKKVKDLNKYIVNVVSSCIWFQVRFSIVTSLITTNCLMLSCLAYFGRKPHTRQTFCNYCHVKLTFMSGGIIWAASAKLIRQKSIGPLLCTIGNFLPAGRLYRRASDSIINTRYSHTIMHPRCYSSTS